MTIPAELIVLNVTKVKDSSVVIHTLSRQFGRKSFIVSLSKSASMALFLPLNILEAEVVENSKSTLWRARNFVSGSPLAGIRGNLYKNSMTLFVSELLFRTLREGDVEAELFDWCKKNILTLDAIEENFSNFHLRFLLEYAVALGFAPSLEDLAPFVGGQLRSVKALLESSFPESMMVPLTGESRNEIAESLMRYLAYHTDVSVNMRSLKVLRELFI